MDIASVDAEISEGRKEIKWQDEGRSVVEEIEGFVRVYKDGSVERFSYAVADVPASHTPGKAVTSMDFVLNEQSGAWARIYLPQPIFHKQHPLHLTRLPLMLYFHGGGFVIGSAAWSVYHVFLNRLASEANSIIISVNYRLAPEHRLPVAYDDCFGALHWLRQQAVRPLQSSDEISWLTSYADFNRCYLAGDSAGANIAHHVTLRAAKTDLKPLIIRGSILIQPFFSGENRSKWECETNDPALPQRWIDVFWKLSLPVGANRDHPACNPLGKQSSRLQDVPLPPMLLCISEQDVLKERNLEYVEALKKAGQNVRYVIIKGVGHAFQVLQPRSPQIQELTNSVSEFVKCV
eukprot:Gb_17665 [translate_table: standard]